MLLRMDDVSRQWINEENNIKNCVLACVAKPMPHDSDAIHANAENEYANDWGEWRSIKLKLAIKWWDEL